jgi:diacylglycerol kinase
MDKTSWLCQRLNSFCCAFRGIFFAFRTQPNIWIHMFAVAVVVAAGFIFGLSTAEWGLVLLAIGLVLTAELVNTAAEIMVDLVSPHPDKKAGLIKDIAAGAVLLAAIIALIIGLIVFIPKIHGL